MKMFAVTDSSVIREIAFDNGTLTVKFIQNRTYYFPNIPYSLFEDFINAPSKGKFFNEHIKNKYFPLR